MPSCLVVADDLTGANTTGVLLQKAGLKALAILNPSGLGGTDAAAFDAVVIPTNSRALDGDAAYRRVFDAVSAHAGPEVRLYSKRIDSTLRGNIGRETDAILDVLGEDSLAIVVPAFPASNRIMVGGYLLVNAVPVHRTEAASDPKNPVDTAKCVDVLLRQGKYRAESIHIADLMQPTPRLAQQIQTLAASGVRYLVCDAAGDDDLLRLAEAVAASGIRFAAVDPGAFTGVMARVLFTPKAEGRSGRVLAAVGSVNGVAMRQAKHYLGGVPSFNAFMRVEEFIAGDERREAEIARLADAVLSAGKNLEVCGILGDSIHTEKRLPLEAVSRERGCSVDELSEVINHAVAEAVGRIIGADESFGGLYTSGGDITIAVCRRLQAAGLRLLDEVLPLAAYAEMIGGVRAGARIISKGGMVGPDDAMSTCVRYLLGKLACGDTTNQGDGMNKPLVAVPLGDPAGIGPEIVVKAVCSPEVRDRARVLVVGDRNVVENAYRITGAPLRTHIAAEPSQGDYAEGVLNLCPVDNVDMAALRIGEVSGMCGRAAYEYIAKAIELTNAGAVDAVATTPINKESLKAGGVDFIGHTEIFGALTNTPDPLTMFEVRGMRVFFLSRHVSLRKACDMVTKERIVDYVHRCVAALRKLGVDKGTMAIAGLNPHSGEHGLFGDEEMTAVYPAVDQLKAEGYDVVGPIGADSVFHLALQGRYNSVLSLYHDQGHIATKTLDFERTIAVTSGMPILRTSVDHGTALDIAGKNIASPVSMIEAIILAAKYSPSFVR